ncbi:MULTISPECIES: hypothetical protein [unclassified Devosia]|uniref:hypothetical protein n=1 Tax=unclassified Devosia TaxID=196773 RepID=UPI0025BE1AE1|nr:MULTISPECIES: hypothetical protein [unclassified Devosia]
MDDAAHPLLKQRLPARLMPLATAMGLRPFYGDIHNHCAISYGHGSLDSALARARQQLDFVSVTGHAYWPDMPVNEPSVAHIVAFHVEGFARLQQNWRPHYAKLAEAHEPGRFTVFPGYEIHSSQHGDYTIVYRDLDQDELIEAESPAELHRRLEARYPGRAFAFPHHIGYREGARGINWRSFDENLSPVLEIVSMHGLSETSLGDRPFLHSMGPADGHSTVEHGLAHGNVFGFLGNTDHHSAYPGSYGHGRSAVYAAENASTAIWDALHARRTVALTGDCAHLFASIDGLPFGSRVAEGPDKVLCIEAVAGSFIDHIDIIRNGRLVERISPEITPHAIDPDGDRFETIFNLELGWGARGSSHDWTGSVRFDGGEILAVEPRLRGPEIVSPLEGEGTAPPLPRIGGDVQRLDFALRAEANPNNSTAATQAIAARVRLSPDSIIHADFDGHRLDIPAARLLDGALSGNLGPIDSPAYRFHPLPRAADWQWTGEVTLGAVAAGETVYVRLRQKNGQWAWASPFFFTSP